MKLGQLVNSKKALETLVKGSLPIHVAWEFRKLIKIIDPEFASFEEIKNQKIIELGEKEIKNKKETGNVKVKPENMDKYMDAINELFNKEIDIMIPKIKIEDLLEYKDVNGKGIEITTGELIQLDWLIQG